MKVTMLGTGTSTGIPMIGCHCEVCRSSDYRDNRTRASVFMETPNNKIIIDTGPDLRIQLLREEIDNIDVVLFTHSHKDHVAGLDDVRPVNYIKNKTIKAYADEPTMERLKAEYPYIFDQDYPGVPLVSFHLIENDLDLDGDEIKLINGMHGNMPVLGFRIGGFAYMTDFNTIEKAEVDKLKSIDTMVINAIHHQAHYSHFNLAEALDIIKMVSPRKAYLTHISHWMGKHEDVEATLPDNVSIAYDGLVLNVPE